MVMILPRIKDKEVQVREEEVDGEEVLVALTNIRPRKVDEI